jgi:hypothetical protein
MVIGFEGKGESLALGPQQAVKLKNESRYAETSKES